MNEYSPGPWRLGGIPILIEDSPPDAVGAAAWKEGAGRSIWDANGEPVIEIGDFFNMTDLHLAAAAPELLEALASLLGWDNCECGHPHCNRGKAAGEARALIRRIEEKP